MAKAKKTPKEMEVSLQTEQKIKVIDVVVGALDKYGAKALLERITAHCLFNMAVASPYVDIVGTNKELETLVDKNEAAMLLGYVLRHWDELMKKAQKEFKKIREDAEAKRAGKLA